VLTFWLAAVEAHFACGGFARTFGIKFFAAQKSADLIGRTIAIGQIVAKEHSAR
jgi:hypothetical protein